MCFLCQFCMTSWPKSEVSSCAFVCTFLFLAFRPLFPIIRSISIPCLPFCKIGPNFFQTVVTMMPDFKSGLSTEYKRKYRIGELGNSGGHQIFPRKCIFAHFIIWTLFSICHFLHKNNFQNVNLTLMIV